VPELKKYMPVQIALICRQASGAEVVCTVGSGAILQPKLVITAHHVLAKIPGNNVVKIQICRQAPDGCAAPIPVTDLQLAQSSDSGPTLLADHDVALIRFQSALLSPTAAAAMHRLEQHSPMALVTPQFTDTLWGLGRAYWKGDEIPKLGVPALVFPTKFQPAPAMMMAPAAKFEPLIWLNNSGLTHDVLRTCDNNMLLSPGFSGASVLDENGNFVGVVTGQASSRFYADFGTRFPSSPGTQCPWSTIISQYPLAWPQKPFTDSFPGVQFVDFDTVASLPLKINLRNTTRLDAAEGRMMGIVYDGLVSLLRYNSIDSVVAYLRDVNTYEESMREWQPLAITCRLYGNPHSCATMNAYSTPALPRLAIDVTKEPNEVQTLVETVDLARDSFGAGRTAALLAATMTRLDASFAMRSDQPPPMPSPAAGPLDAGTPTIDCGWSADTVVRGPFERVLGQALSLSLDENLHAVLDRVDDLRTVYSQFESATPPDDDSIRSALTRELGQLNTDIAARLDYWQWPAGPTVDIDELPLRCFSHSPRLQRRVWAAVATAGLVPYRSLDLEGSRQLLAEQWDGSAMRFVSAVRVGGAFDKLLADADKKSPQRGVRYRAALDGAINQLNSSGILDVIAEADAVGPQDRLKTLLVSSFRRGLSRTDWQQAEGRMAQLRCLARQILAEGLGATSESCS
jgi:hypothetical protein